MCRRYLDGDRPARGRRDPQRRRFAIERMKQVLEPAGAAALAARPRMAGSRSATASASRSSARAATSTWPGSASSWPRPRRSPASRPSPDDGGSRTRPSRRADRPPAPGRDAVPPAHADPRARRTPTGDGRDRQPGHRPRRRLVGRDPPAVDLRRRPVPRRAGPDLARGHRRIDPQRRVRLAVPFARPDPGRLDRHDRARTAREPVAPAGGRVDRRDLGRRPADGDRAPRRARRRDAPRPPPDRRVGAARVLAARVRLDRGRADADHPPPDPRRIPWGTQPRGEQPDRDDRRRPPVRALRVRRCRGRPRWCGSVSGDPAVVADRPGAAGGWRWSSAS